MNEKRYSNMKQGQVIAQAEQRNSYETTSLLHVLECIGEFKYFIPSPVALRPNAGHGLLILEVSRSYTTTHHNL